MSGVGDTVRVRLNETRTRRPAVDHLLRTLQHFGQVQGTAHAGGVTFFGFLSVFPLLALAFFALGLIASTTGATLDLVQTVNGVVPGLIGSGEGQIPLSTIESAAGAALGIGLVGLVYAGLNLLSGMRTALLIVFEQPVDEQPNFVIGKLRDLLALLSLGAILLVSVGVSSVVNLLSSFLLGLVGLDDDLAWALRLLTVVIGLAASTVLFYALFRVLGRPLAPNRALWQGALLGAVGFEILKQLSGVLIGSTQNQPAFAVFGVALVLLVWINYSARLILIAASWVHTSDGARLLREKRTAEEQARHASTAVELRKRPPAPASPGPRSFGAGVLSALGAVFLLQRRRRRDR
ncbi:YihY/virulence factor BrkB family protein [uncultured Nocardioides sp.]|uniref:YihY/virulence factor BrkB family protein n=1 Tax=uncultured Nocardioides sp. TaxID=198441 RepID=UPI00261F398A|nr:YihY/virulence factor BrkB family protein [uncultured Nocardioides sp.]